MKKVVALQTWSNGTITMEEKSVMDIDDTLADSLIAAGICADAEDYFGTGGGGGGGGVLMVHVTVTEEGGEEVYTLDTTYADIAAAGFCILDDYADGVHGITTLEGYGYVNGTYRVIFQNEMFVTDSENGYPVLQNIS